MVNACAYYLSSCLHNESEMNKGLATAIVHFLILIMSSCFETRFIVPSYISLPLHITIAITIYQYMLFEMSSILVYVHNKINF